MNNKGYVKFVQEIGRLPTSINSINYDEDNEHINITCVSHETNIGEVVMFLDDNGSSKYEYEMWKSNAGYGFKVSIS